MKLIDRIYEKADKTNSVLTVGLDPDITQIPDVFLKSETMYENLLEYNKFIINIVKDLVPAVKLQSAFYEIYAEEGFKALRESIKYAKGKGLITIVDVKRNDIGNTAKQYADAFIGDEKSLYGFKADIMTVTPFLGMKTVEPFMDNVKQYDKGVFILAKTSNSDAHELQGSMQDENSLTRKIIDYIKVNYTDEYICGVVAGATHSSELKMIREQLPKHLFLVPGYGKQGGTVEDIKSVFYEKNRGALINSSRGILYSYLSNNLKETITKEEYEKEIKKVVIQANKELDY